MSEDERAAVGMSVTLSGQLGAAALAMIAVASAFTTFLTDKRVTNLTFGWLMSLCILCFIASVFCGGKGVTAARNEGFHGNWTLLAGKTWFGGQALAAFLGLGLFFLAIVSSGKSKDDTAGEALNRIASSVGDLSKKMTELVAQQKLDQQFAHLGESFEARQDALESDFRKELTILQSLNDEEQQNRKAVQELKKIVADLQTSQTNLITAVRDLTAQVTSIKEPKGIRNQNK
jgi:methyl-accepting chemotaxis protein